MLTFPQIRIEDFDYPLPDDLIAQQPSEIRDESRLLVSGGTEISEDRFFNLDHYLPENSVLVFNNTRVIRARILFLKESGTRIEIFCLEPVTPTREIARAFQAGPGTEWSVLIGNLKRWKSGELVIENETPGKEFRFSATLISRQEDGSAVVRFDWDHPEIQFGTMLEMVGKIPLPPYIRRNPEERDSDRYQTIYAEYEGSVAAPTAGLHFTPRVLHRLESKGVERLFITLHVGVGTFRNVTAKHIADHVMHPEKISVACETISALLHREPEKIIAVGTTAARTLESLYWAGCHVLVKNGNLPHQILQWAPYSDLYSEGISLKESLGALEHSLKIHKMSRFEAETQLIILPGYRFRILSGLITNFHIPKSTLLMLVAALTGDQWKRAYQYAIENRFRFLSYGDSCLFLGRQ